MDKPNFNINDIVVISELGLKLRVVERVSEGYIMKLLQGNLNYLMYSVLCRSYSGIWKWDDLHRISDRGSGERDEANLGNH